MTVEQRSEKDPTTQMLEAIKTVRETRVSTKQLENIREKYMPFICKFEYFSKQLSEELREAYMVPVAESRNKINIHGETAFTDPYTSAMYRNVHEIEELAKQYVSTFQTALHIGFSLSQMQDL